MNNPFSMFSCDSPPTRWLFILSLIFVVFACPAAHAGSKCRTNGNIGASFGNIDSLTLNTIGGSTSAAPGVNCNDPGDFSGGIGRNWLYVSVENPDGGSTLRPLRHTTTGETIGLTAKIDGSAVVVGQRYDQSNYMYGGNVNNKNLALELVIPPGATVSAGTYTTVVRTRWYWNLCSGTILSAVCWSVWDRSNGLTMSGCVGNSCTASAYINNYGTGEVADITLTLVVDNSCNIVTLPQVAFGSAPLVSGFTSITPSMTIRCTKTAPYSISLSNGNSGGSPREMWLAGDSSKKLKYELYKPGSSADRWGDTGTARFENLIGSGLNQDYSFRAEILPGQPTPPSGTYTDNIQLTVTY